MIPKVIIRFLLVTLLIIGLLIPTSAQASLLLSILQQNYQVMLNKTPVYYSPEDEKPVSYLYGETDVHMLEDKEDWYQVEINRRNYWIPKSDLNMSMKNESGKRIQDIYGILEQPHNYAIKLVKFEGAKGRLETYKKIDRYYIFQNSYEVTYPKEGPKDLYGDLKTVGGPFVRYVYRTTRSGMNGRNKDGEFFGVYKISYPMPHDALPYFIEGKMGMYGYNRIPILNYRGEELIPHPHSMMGADILIHTAAKGSLGCINVKNEEMATLYHEDLVTENNKEIIPLIIYDEDMEAPEVGQLF